MPLMQHQQVRFLPRIIPALLTLLVQLLSVIPSYSLGDGTLTPSFTLVLVFYWCLYWPQTLPYFFLFLLGILQDALHSSPLGLFSIIYMGTAYLIQSQRQRMGTAVFINVWLTFALLSFMATMVEWSIICLYASTSFGLKIPFLRWAITVALYPLLHLLLTSCYQKLRGKS